MSTPVYLDTYLGERQIQPRGLMAYFACTEVTILRGGNYKWINLIVGCSSNLKSIKGNVYYDIFFFYIILYLLNIYL
jgi:hypothetical protein